MSGFNSSTDTSCVSSGLIGSALKLGDGTDKGDDIDLGEDLIDCEADLSDDDSKTFDAVSGSSLLINFYVCS